MKTIKQNLITFLFLVIVTFSQAQTWNHFPVGSQNSVSYIPSNIIGVDNQFVYIHNKDVVIKYNKQTGDTTSIKLPATDDCNGYSYRVKLGINGVLWVASNFAGLNRYTNGSWINYNTTNSTMIGNYVTNFDISPSGKLYVINGHSSISTFDGSAWAYYDANNTGLINDSVFVNLYNIDAKCSNKVMFSTSENKKVFFDGNSTWDTNYASLSTYNNIYNLSLENYIKLIDINGAYWTIGHDSTSFYYLKYENNSWSTTKSDTFFCSNHPDLWPEFIGRNSPIILSRNNMNIYIHNIQTNTCDSFSTTNQLYTVMDDANGDLWFTDYTGTSTIYHYNANANVVSSILTLNNIFGATNNFPVILPSHTDVNNHVWFGGISGSTTNANAAVYEFIGDTFMVHNMAPYLVNPNQGGVYSIAEDVINNKMYFGLTNSKLVTYQNNVWDSVTIVSYSNLVGQPNITGLALDRNNNLVASFSSDNWNAYDCIIGIAIRNGNAWTYDTLTHHGASVNNAFCITVDTSQNRNNYWIGTIGSGIMVKTPTGYQHLTTTNSGLPNDTIQCIAIDNFGRKWIGTFNGLAVYNDTTWTVYNSNNSAVPFRDIEYVAFDPNNNYTPWVATEGGVVTYNNGAWLSFLPCVSPITNRDVESITFDNNCNVWLPNENGSRGFIDRINNYCAMDEDSVSGTVLRSNGLPYANHMMHLFKKNSNGTDLLKIGQTVTNSNGHYAFRTNESNVYIYSTYDGINNPNELPVYQNNKVTMQDASSIIFNSNNHATVNLQNVGTSINSGAQCSISGYIQNLYVVSNSNDLPIFLVNTQTLKVERMVILNYYNNFSFTNLPHGKYKIYVDKFGIDNSLTDEIDLTNIETLSNLEFIFRPHKLELITEYLSIKNTTNDSNVLLFPNPTKDNLTLSTKNEQPFTYKIYNMLGSEIITGKSQSNLVSIDLSALPNGLYIAEFANQRLKFVKN